MARAETEQLTKMILGAALSRALATVAELGVADQIDTGSPKTVEELAAATGAHERSLYRLMRYLASHGLFVETAGRHFDHTPLSHCLRDDAEGSFRAGARMFHRISPAWDGLHHAVTTGGTAFESVFGQPLFDYVGAHADLAPLFDAGMTAIHGHETAAMIDAFDFGELGTLADIGGGNGSLLTAILKSNPNLTGILFDLGHVVGRARDLIGEQGVGDRCSVVEGNFFESIPGGAAAYLFRHIIHDWNDEQSVQILGNCRQVIADDGRLLVAEFVVPDGNEPSLAKDSDITMMVFPGGIERTEAEYAELFEQAGFRLSSVTPTESSISIVEGRPS